MNKRGILAGLLLISISVGATGCKKENVSVSDKNNTTTIVKDTKDIKATKTAKVKTDTYEGVSGVKWIDENNIIISKVNKELPPIKVDSEKVKADFDVKNLYLYDLNSKNEKLMGSKSEYIESGVVSPDQRHIFYTSENKEDGTGYISDTNGNIITKISDSDIDAYDIKNANWINDKQIIIPCNHIGGFAVINIDGNIEKIKDVEKTNNEKGIDALSIINPVKVGDKIYYTKIHRGQEEDNKLIAYDIKTKEKKMVIKDDILEFKLSNNKDQLVAIVYNSDRNTHELTIMDLDGKNRQILTEGSIESASWSKDGSKIAYTSYEEYESGVYIVDTKTKEKELVTEGNGYYNLEYSPSCKKLMVNRTIDAEKSSKYKLFPEQISTTNIISLEE